MDLRLAPGVTVPEGMLVFSTSRSGGPGGQHVNKTESKVELRVPLHAIVGLGLRALDRLAVLAGERLTADGELILTCEETRSQRQNRELVIERLGELIREARAVPKVRRPSKPTWGSKQRRLGEKSQRAEVKRQRRTTDD
jgi:ribosome-associated protein